MLTDLASGLVEATVQAAHFERRQGAVSAARKLFDDALAAEEAKEGKSLLHRVQTCIGSDVGIMSTILKNQIKKQYTTSLKLQQLNWRSKHLREWSFSKILASQCCKFSF